MSHGKGEIPWGIIIMLLIVCFPAGVVLLILRFMLPVVEQLVDGGHIKQKKIDVHDFRELKDSKDPSTLVQNKTAGSGATTKIHVHSGKVSDDIRSGQYSFTRDQLSSDSNKVRSQPVTPNEKSNGENKMTSNPRSYINDPLDAAQTFTTKNSSQPVKSDNIPAKEQTSKDPVSEVQLKKLIPSGGYTAFQVLGIIFGSIGFILAGIFGIIGLIVKDDIGLIIAATVFAIMPGLPGLVMLSFGLRGKAQAQRFRRYYELIGSENVISIDRLAEVMDVSYNTALLDLQKMLDKGILKNAYIDKAERTYNIGNPFDALKEKEAIELRMIEQEKIPDAARRIRQLNDDIKDEDVSIKLDKLELITRRIFEYVEQKPELMPKLKNFTGYYLPTTLKILEAYARFEKQEVQGKNMSAAMEDIEELLDTLIKSFESQLDQLYDNETLDVSTDITVLENMLEREGLTDNGFRIDTQN